MTHDFRVERRRVRLFFAGLLVVSAILDVVGALLIQHQTRTQVLDSLLPTSVTLGGRTGAVLSGLALLLLAGGIARGKRVALRLTLLVLAANIGFDLVKDLDFEFAFLLAWILFGLWWFRPHFQADSDPASVQHQRIADHWNAHVPPLSAAAVWVRSALGSVLQPGMTRPSPA